MAILCAAMPISTALAKETTPSNATAQVVRDRSPIPQPYDYAKGSFSGPAVAESPDPLVAYRWPNPKISDPLEIYVLRPTVVWTDAPQSFANLATLTGEKPDVAVSGVGAIRLDFGVESGAWVEFDSPDCPGDVEMSISEYNEPGVDKTRAPVKIGNTFRLKLNDELYDGVRFAWIHVKATGKPWHITGVRAVCQVKPTNYVGSFACSDPMLTRIWYMAAYGVKASRCKDYFGSILMDRGDRISWTGDAHTIQAAALVAFGNADAVRQNLDSTAKMDNGIRSYALYWVLSLLDYYNYTGDEATLREYLDNARAKLDGAYRVFGTNPPLRFYGWDERVGAGFEIWFRPNEESQRAYKMLSIRAWHDFAQAMNHCGRFDLRDQYDGYANAKLAELQRDKDWYADFGIHAAADAVNTGLLDGPTRAALYDKEFGDRVNRLSLSPFNEFFILQALARLGKYDDALTSVRDMWGGMVSYGGTTPFEVYRPSWNVLIGPNDAVPNAQCGIVSLCHPWGAGVVKWLSEETLGIVPTSPGFVTYDITPHLGSTLTRVSGATPTPHGVIRVRFDMSNGSGQVTAPPGAVGRIGVPKAGRSITRIFINEKLAWDGRFHAVAGIESAGEDADFVYFNKVQPGDYAFATSYRGKAKVVAPAPEVYAAKFVGRDTATGGDWGGKYGRDGYVLCAYHADGSDQQVLPDYVKSLDFFRAFPQAGRPDSTRWAESTADRRALAPDAANGTPRAAACLSNNDQTMTVTITTNVVRKYRVALYFVDWDKRGRRSVVEMFDAQSLRLIAPVELIKNHEGGCYLVYEYDRSVKFRFCKIRGDLLTLSGLFFDSPEKP